MVTVVVTSRCFRRLLPSPFRFSFSSALSFFSPWLGAPFCSCAPQTLLWLLLTSPRLSAGGSPRVSSGSFCSGLWALHHVISELWASRVLACSPLTCCLAAHLCSFGRAFAFHPFAPLPRGSSLAVDYGWRHQPPSGTFHPDRHRTCRAHKRGRRYALPSPLPTELGSPQIVFFIATPVLEIVCEAGVSWERIVR